MWEPYAKFRDPTMGTIWAALLCTLFTEYTSSTRSEIYSELLSWIALPGLCRLVKYISDSRSFSDSKSEIGSSYSEQFKTPSSLWIIALSIALSCAYKTENRVIQFFVRCFHENDTHTRLTRCLAIFNACTGAIAKTNSARLFHDNNSCFATNAGSQN
jgi:hypothetical protein